MKNLVKLFSLFFLMTGLIGFAQGTVSGTVTDTDGLPLPGATVVVQGTSIGVTSDFDGNYSISASQGDVLVFSYVGYTSQSIAVGTSSTVNVSLESSTALEEVVVTGISSIERQRSVSSVSVVESELLENLSFTSPDQALAGRVSGLRIATISGSPGSASSIRIRGESSLTGNNSPLFVIDGIPIDNGTVSTGGSTVGVGILSMIDPNDIESITVLKDASSTSAYGNRGSNGVIVITTKKGSAGDVKFNISSKYGIQNYAVEGRKMLTGNQYFELATEMMVNSYPNLFDTNSGAAWVLANLPGYGDWYDNGRIDGGWQDLVEVEDAPFQDYNISATGGNSSENFRISLGYKDQEGVSIGQDYEQISGSINYTKKTGRATISTSNRVSSATQNGQLESSAYFGAPQATRYFMSERWRAKNDDGSWWVPHPASAHHTPYLIEKNIYKVNNTRALSNSKLVIDLAEGLDVSTTFAIDYNIGDTHVFQNAIEGDGVGEQGYARQTSSKRFAWTTINQLNYRNSFDNKHFVTATLSQSFQRSKNNFVAASGEAPAAEGLYFVNSFTVNQSGNGSFSDYKQLSYVGLLNYSFRDKYIFNFTWRNDGSSRFGPDYRFGNFFSYGIAWNLSNENFLADSSFVNNLKLRASIGETGQSNIGLNQYQSLFGYSADYNDQGAVFPTSFGNSIISWEKNDKLDIAVDFEVFNSRISGSVGYYNQKSFDLLQSVPLSRTTGHSSQTQNVGDVLNEGWEIEFDAEVLKINDFSWDLYGNYTKYYNEILRLAQTADGEYINLDSFFYANRVGRPMDVWNLRQWGGVNSETGNAYFIKGGDADKGPVSEEIVDSYSQADPTMNGQKLPKFSGAFGTRLKYKNFTIDGNFTFQGGHKIYEYWATYYMHSGLQALRSYAGAAELMDRWQKPGDVTDVPKMAYTSSTTAQGSYWNSRFLSDGDMIRLRDLVINYRFTPDQVKTLGLNNVDVYLKGTNIWTWTKADIEYDPEVSLASGFNNIYTPIPSSWSLGVNINF